MRSDRHGSCSSYRASTGSLLRATFSLIGLLSTGITPFLNAATILTGDHTVEATQSEAGDLTVEGSLHIESQLDFGTTSETTPQAAVNLFYGESGSVYTIRIGASRDNTGFLWEQNAGGTAELKMKLAHDNVLSLYDVTTGVVKITLNPNTGKITLGTGGGIVLPDGTLVSGISNFRSTALYDALGNPKLTVNASGDLLFSGEATFEQAIQANGGVEFAPGVGLHPSNTAYLQQILHKLGYRDGQDPVASTALGESTTASGWGSTTMGTYSIASGESSTAMGHFANASGSYSTAIGYTATASGFSSTAMGSMTNASGDSSTAMGYYTLASGASSIAMGEGSSASGDSSTAMGEGSNASGYSSTALGFYTEAMGPGELVVGHYNLTEAPLPYDEWDPTTWPATGQLFVVGNGTHYALRSNALVVRRNGNTEVSGNLLSSGTDNTLPNQALTGASSILTQGLADGRYVRPAALDSYLTTTTAGSTYLTQSGATSIYLSQSNATATYLTQANASGTYLTQSAAASVYLTPTSGDALFLTPGEGNNNYIAMSQLPSLLTESDAALTYQAKSGPLAIGGSVAVTGAKSAAVGSNLSVAGYQQFVIGSYHEESGSTTAWEPNDPLFVVANGGGPSARSNAVVVRKNGNTEFNGDVSVTGTLRVPESGDLSMGEFAPAP